MLTYIGSPMKQAIKPMPVLPIYQAECLRYQGVAAHSLTSQFMKFPACQPSISLPFSGIYSCNFQGHNLLTPTKTYVFL